MKPTPSDRRILAITSGIGSFPREITLQDMINKFPVEEAVRIAYIPIILTKAAFQFAEFIAKQCAEYRLPYKKETRLIKQSIYDYERETLGQVKIDVLETLENQVGHFFDEAGDNVQTLWYVINAELKKRYPKLENYDLLTNVYVCVSILEYVRCFEAAADHTIQERTSMPYVSIANRQSVDVRNACLSIADKYKIQQTEMIHLAIRVIANKVDSMVVSVVEP